MENTNEAPIKPETRKQIRAKVGNMPYSQAAVRYMVDFYYQIQDVRKVSGNQLGAMHRAGEEINEFTRSTHKRLNEDEKYVTRWLDEICELSAVGKWAKSITGIGPVISAGLLAHIDIKMAPTAGHIWRFAGLDPTQHWLGREKAKALVKQIESGSLKDAVPLVAEQAGMDASTLLRLASTDKEGSPVKLTAETLSRAAARRPWNAKLKTLCWQIGECFVRTSNNPSAYYGQLWRMRKTVEEAKNERGDFAMQAADILKAKKFDKSTEAYKAYSQGKLPPAHVHARAKRWAVKLFLSHWQWVAWESEYGTPPAIPYVIEHMGHVDILRPPNWN